MSVGPVQEYGGPDPLAVGWVRGSDKARVRRIIIVPMILLLIPNSPFSRIELRQKHERDLVLPMTGFPSPHKKAW
jgi:hypothetical protein